MAEDARADEGLCGDAVEPLGSFADLNAPAWKTWLAEANARAALTVAPALAPPGLSQTILTEAAAAEAAAAAAIAAKQRDAFTLKMTPPPTADKRPAFPELRAAEATPSTPADVRLHHRAAVVAAGDESTGLVGLVRQLSIDQFENENRRISFGVGEVGAPGSANRRGNLTPVRTPSGDGVHKKVLELLLRPREWRAPADRSFILDITGIEELCDRCEAIMKQDPTVLQLGAPVKIFGDLHGQFGDLMRLFAEYGSPSTAGDMPYIDYLFLGDYVDRGAHSLETICLLLALKARPGLHPAPPPLSWTERASRTRPPPTAGAPALRLSRVGAAPYSRTAD